MDLIDLKKEPEQAYSEGEMYEDQPAYSYGLCISLGEEELAKLGIEELPAAGAEMMIKAMAYVKTASEKKEMDGTSKHLELQICAMGIDPIDKSKDNATSLYGNDAPAKEAPRSSGQGIADYLYKD
tara:strand:+ start:735 stop:1112 length:378 start_codon:yes stop_codon:yes gene_type:complete